MTIRRPSLAKLVLTLFLALSTMAGAWTGRPVNLSDEIALDQFVLAGGSVADLCDETGTAGGSGTRHGHDCQTCCLTGLAALLPGRAMEAPALAGGVSPAPRPVAEAPVLAARWREARPRAPPALA